MQTILHFFYSDADCNHVTNRLSHELSICKRWLVDNRLSLHIGKTEFILFGSSLRLKRANAANVTCDGVAVRRVQEVKYLGVLLDCCFNGNRHVFCFEDCFSVSKFLVS